MKRYAALPIVLLTGTAVLMALAWQQHREAGKPWTFLIVESAAGLMISGGGVLIWRRRPQNRCGWLLLAAGFCFWFGDFEHATRSVGSWSFAFGLWYDAFLAWAVLAFPHGRLRTRPERVTVVAVFAMVAIRTLSRLFLFVPADAAGFGTSNQYFPIHDDRWWRAVDDWFDRLFPLAIVVVFGLVLAHWIRSSRPGRQMLSPALFAAALLAASVGYSNIVGWNAGIGARGNIRAFYVVWLAHGVLSLALGIGMERLRGTRSRVVDLFSELNTSAPPQGLGQALGRALGDPNLTLVPWSCDADAFVDACGERVDLDDVGARRATTFIEREGEPVAVLVHDEALLEDPGLVNAVVAAIRLTADNELLQSELRAQLAEVAASRSRIMEAGDLERQKIERNLHDGAQQRLVTTALSLRLAETQLSDSSDPRVNEVLSKAISQLAEAITELRDLGRGIHPAVLTEFGSVPP